MRMRYTIQCTEPDDATRAFEDILSFGEGFRHLDVPPSIGVGRLTALAIDPGFHVNFQFCRLQAPLEIVKEWKEDATRFITFGFYDLQVPQKAWFRGNEVVYDQQG